MFICKRGERGEVIRGGIEIFLDVGDGLVGLASSGPLLSAPLLGQTVRPCATCSDKLGKEEEEEEGWGGLSIK